MTLTFAPVNHLAVRIVTGSQWQAGTDNTIWFDIGPLGWKLDTKGGNFEKGADETFELPVPAGMTTHEITRFRIEKKGMFGVTGTPEGAWGGWRPSLVELRVNGHPWHAVDPGKWFEDDDQLWVHELRPTWSERRRTVRNTRRHPNEGLDWWGTTLSALTTPFAKGQGISGWQATGSWATVIGSVVREPPLATDGLATVDVQIGLLEIDGVRYRCDLPGISSPRYIRVEMFFLPPVSFPVPASGSCVRVSGELMWDTDHEGWFEIHPFPISHLVKNPLWSPPSDAKIGTVEILPPGSCDADSLPAPPPGRGLSDAFATDFPASDPGDGLHALDACLGEEPPSLKALLATSGF